MIFYTLSTTVMSAPLLINILMISGLLMRAAKCNAVQPSCNNKTKKQNIHNLHYTDQFQLNVLVVHSTFIMLMMLCKHPLCDVVDNYGTIII